MKKTDFMKKLSFFLCMMLIAAMALFTTGCNDNAGVQNETMQNEATVESSDESTAQTTDAQIVGEGMTSFPFTIVDADGKESFYEVHTDKEIVGEALLDNGLIAGDAGDYGLYVKEVGGTRADFEKDGAYWSFYVDGEYAMSGVDMTKIETGKTYTFKYEKQ